MEKTLKVLNELAKRGIIRKYAIGGGVGVIFYMENNHRMQKTAEALFHAKQKRRRKLSQLSFEEKIRILADLQKMASEVQRTVGGMKRRPWQLS